MILLLGILSILYFLLSILLLGILSICYTENTLGILLLGIYCMIIVGYTHCTRDSCMIIGFIVGFPTKGILERLLGVSGYRFVMDINTRELPFRKK